MKFTMLCLTVFAVVGCLVTPSGGAMYYYDWKAMGVRAPSVLPEISYDTVEFSLTAVQPIPEIESPPVLAPYNITMPLNRVLKGTIGGKATEIFTDQKLAAPLADAKAGTILVLQVGKKNPAHVYSIGRGATSQRSSK